MRKALECLLIVWAVLTIAFFGLRYGRADPIAGLLAQGSLSAGQAQSMRHDLALDEPIGIQYGKMLIGMIRGEWGRSIFSGEEAAPMVLNAVAYTAPLALAAWLAAVLIGIGLGALASHVGEPGWAGWLAGWIAPLLSAGIALPVALTGLILLWVAVPVQSMLADEARAALTFFCAVFVLAVNIGCAIARTVQASIQAARREPFYLAMRASGIPEGLGMDVRLLRTCIAPVFSLAGMEAGFLLGGTMMVEIIFARPGLGRLGVDAILRGDFPVVQATLALGALGYCICAMVAETFALFLDPGLQKPL
jgi:peptide/nickel transport system permease protein